MTTIRPAQEHPFATVGNRETAGIWRRWLELVALYVGLPGAIYLILVNQWFPVRPFALLPPLLVLTAWIFRRMGKPRWRPHPCWHPGPMLVRALLGSLLLVPFTLTFFPQHWLAFISRAPERFLFVVVLYPILSVWPQEFLYRRFFFARYAGVIPGGGFGLALASTLLFAWLHVIFGNWPSLVLTLVGGWFFADTYRRSGSLFWTCVEHAILGLAIFAVGLGRFFYLLAGP